jgi:hypothetical protein
MFVSSYPTNKSTLSWEVKAKDGAICENWRKVGELRIIEGPLKQKVKTST